MDDELKMDDELRNGFHFGISLTQEVYTDGSIPDDEKSQEIFNRLSLIASGKVTLGNPPADSRQDLQQLAEDMPAKGIDPSPLQNYLENAERLWADSVRRNRELARRLTTFPPAS